MPDVPDIADRKPTTDLAATGLLNLGFMTREEPQRETLSSSRIPLVEKVGDSIGRYRLLAPLGQGGFGCVWRVEQTQPIQRELALKLIKPGMDSREIIARFEAEKQALALMDHPNIAAVLDAGTTATMRPYFVMELVRGEPLTDYCDHHKLGFCERLKLFLAVCQAVQHAHQKAILHRDLKPSNILVATVDGNPVPKVIDFGIAKALGSSEGSAANTLLRTQQGVVVGTPRYMSPEQAGSMPDVDTRSDVYSLGAILCEMLTGQSPFPQQPEDLLDALRWVREVEPMKPSTLVREITPAVLLAARQRSADPLRFAKYLRGDLDWIILKAIEKDRSRRYESPAALARDLERHLAQEPVSAVAPTWRYRMGKFAKRQRAMLVAGGLIGVAMMTGTIVSLWQASRAERSRREAESHFMQARDAVDQYLARVSDHPKLKESNFIDLQRDLLETALPFYEKMSQYQGDDSKLLESRGWALSKLAWLYQSIGESTKAEKAYEETLATLSQMLKNHPDDLKAQKDLAFQYDEFGAVLRALDKSEEALASYDKSIRLHEDLLMRFPGDRDARAGLSSANMNKAMALTSFRKPYEAEKAFNKSAAVLEELLRTDGNRPEYLNASGICLGAMAILFMDNREYEKAEDLLRRAINYHQRAVAGAPNFRIYRHALGIVLSNHGKTLMALKRGQEAEAALRKALDLQQLMVNEFSTVPSYREALISTCRSLSNHLSAQGQSAEAEALLNQAAADQKRLVSDYPKEVRYAEDLVAMLSTDAEKAFMRKQWDTAEELYAEVLAAKPHHDTYRRLYLVAMAKEDHAAAVKYVLKYMELAPASWQFREFAAGMLSNVIPLIEKDVKLDAITREQRISECSDQITEVLRDSIAKGFAGMSQFNSTARPATLTQRADYQELLHLSIRVPEKCPKRFSFDYPHKNPGPRHWTREGVILTESEPGEVKNTFVIAGPVTVHGTKGTEIRRMKANVTLFVPDLDTSPPLILKIKLPDGSWSMLGTMYGVK